MREKGGQQTVPTPDGACERFHFWLRHTQKCWELCLAPPAVAMRESPQSTSAMEKKSINFPYLGKYWKRWWVHRLTSCSEARMAIWLSSWAFTRLSNSSKRCLFLGSFAYVSTCTFRLIGVNVHIPKSWFQTNKTAFLFCYVHFCEYLCCLSPICSIFPVVLPLCFCQCFKVILFSSFVSSCCLPTLISLFWLFQYLSFPLPSHFHHLSSSLTCLSPSPLSLSLFFLTVIVISLHLIGWCHVKVKCEGLGLLSSKGWGDEFPGGCGNSVFLQVVHHHQPVFIKHKCSFGYVTVGGNLGVMVEPFYYHLQTCPTKDGSKVMARQRTMSLLTLICFLLSLSAGSNFLTGLA